MDPPGLGTAGANPAGGDLKPAPDLLSGAGRDGFPNSRIWLTASLATIVGLAAIYLLLAPLSADHAAQTFRTELFRSSGATIWNNYWFGGHYLPTYSLLAPPLGAWLGFRTMGVLAVIGTVLLFGLVARREWGEAARYGVLWFAPSAAISLFSGRITFALGVLIATSAVAAARWNLRLPALVLAAGTGLASPVAALFLSCLGFSHFLERSLSGERSLRGLEIAVVAFASSGAVAVMFPGGGDEPYVWSSFVPAIGLTVAAAFLVPPTQRLVRTGIAVYAASLVATFLIATPMGGNVNRLGTLLLGPLTAIAVTAGGAGGRARRALLALLFVGIVAWQAIPVTRDLRQVHDQPQVEASFYLPLERALEPRLARRPARVEVVPVASHWESARTAPAFPLARGWERQTDRNLNRIFYRGRISPGEYRRWLDGLAVGWVAVPDTRLDYAGEREAALVRSGLRYLREVPVDGPWRLFRVLDPVPMAEAPAALTELDTSGFTVISPKAGAFTIRIRQSPYFQVVSGSGCVGGTDAGWLSVRFARPGRISVESRFSPGARFRGGESCRR